MKTTNGAFIIDSLGKILVTHPNGHSMDLWSIPKGLTDTGETSREATEREVWEETRIDLGLFINKTTYFDLGIFKYTSNKKKLHAHFYHIDLPLSEMDLNIKCLSMYLCEKTDRELPENDITRWETMVFAEEFLHYTQKSFLKKVDDLLVSNNLN
jgi:8-oxo-dGTP pyrophosphatase MutT (NUDIX family)